MAGAKEGISLAFRSVDYFRFLLICENNQYHFYKSKRDFEEMCSCMKASKRKFKAYRLIPHR